MGLPNCWNELKFMLEVLSDVSSPSLGPPARPSEANFAMLKPARSPKTSKKGKLNHPKARNRYPEPAFYLNISVKPGCINPKETYHK